MQFCIRDDDTSYFTSPDELEAAYGTVTNQGPVSLAIVPFCQAGTSKGVPERYRGQWSLHPLHHNTALVSYLRAGIAAGRFEAMLHGYHHDEQHRREEFASGNDLFQRVRDGRRYLEDLLGTAIRVFVPPRNAIGREGLSAIARAGLHLAGTVGLRAGWPVLSRRTWTTWYQLWRWRKNGGIGIPWVLNLGDHREIPGNAVTPVSSVQRNESAFANALRVDGVFCLATHYWELGAPSHDLSAPPVGEQVYHLVARVAANPRIEWRSVGDTVMNPALMI